MADDDIDYNITFPSKAGVNGEDEKEPVILLLGWAGCEDKYLSKYSRNLYDIEGYITLRYTAPLEDLVFHSSNLKKRAHKLLELLADFGLETNPLFIHVLSNGGGRLYRHITELIHLEKSTHNQQLSGVIFDSCPSDLNPWIYAKTTYQMMKRNVLVKSVCAVSMFIYCYIAPVIELLLRPFVKLQLAGSDYWHALIADSARCPQLLLYSKADKLIDYHDVERFAALRSKRGIEVSKYCFSDSPHVQHFRRYPNEYTLQCGNFIKTCLSKLSFYRKQ